MLNAFEQATLEQLVSYKAKNENDIARFMQCEKLQNQAKTLCQKWNKQRTNNGWEPWT